MEQENGIIKMTALERAVEKAGGQTSLAKKLTLDSAVDADRSDGAPRVYTQSHVWNWLQTKAPANVCRKIERLTGVKSEDLRPDVFG